MKITLPNLLRTCNRNIRITRDGIRRRGRIQDAGAPRFAESIFGRYTDRDGSETENQFTFRTNKVGAAIQHFHSHRQVHIQPRILLTVLNWNANSVPVDRSLPAATGVQWRIPQETQHIQTVIQRSETYLLEQFVERFALRKQRMEVSTQASLASYAVPAVPEVKRILRNSPTRITDQVSPDATIVQKLEAKQPEQKSIYPIPRATDAAMDLNRLTDQIIQTIDQRIIAQRERLGRV